MQASPALKRQTHASLATAFKVNQHRATMRLRDVKAEASVPLAGEGVCVLKSRSTAQKKTSRICI